MMTENRAFIIIATFVGLAAVFILTGILGAIPVRAQPPEKEPSYATFFTNTDQIQLQDLSGAVVGEGTHLGKMMCNTSNCSQKTEVQLDFTVFFTDPAAIAYKFGTRQAHDPEARRVVVDGSGTLTTDRMKEKFRFTATFEDNRDGTVTVIYEASRPDVSFIITAPGRFVIESRP
jgi:hypothetical protein